MKTRVSLLFAAVVISSTAMGQRSADVTTTFEQNIQQILLNPLNGHILVKEKTTLSDYNPETKQVDWKINQADLVKVGAVEQAQKVLDILSGEGTADANSLTLIEGSPYARAIIEGRDIVINSIDGKVVFNSGTAGYRILQSQFLPELEELLLLTNDDKKIYFVLWNMKNGAETWKTELGTVESLGSALKNMFKNNASTDKSEAVGDAIFTSSQGTLYKLDKQSGKLLWQSKDKINNFFLSQNADKVIVVKNKGSLLSSKQALNVWNSTDGSPLWKNDIETKYIIYLEDWGEKILIAHASGFNFYAYADGKKVWKKDAKGSSIKRVIPLDQDYLYIADTEMNLIGQDGQSKWKKFVQICDKPEDPVYFLDVLGEGKVAYITGSLGNMVDYKTGQKIWKKNLEFDPKKTVLFALDDATSTFLVYNDEKVYKFDAKTTERPEPLAKLKKLKDEKSISDLELFDWGISLVGEGDVIGVDMNGQVKYQNTYTEPGGTKRKLVKGLGKVAGFSMGAAAAVTQAEVVFTSRDANGNAVESRANLFDKGTRNTGSAMGFAAGLLNSKVVAGAERRFQAMKANNEYAFVLSKSDKGPVLIKVKKADGTEVDKIDIDNNKPIYEVDPVNDAIYYVYKNELRTFN